MNQEINILENEDIIPHLSKIQIHMLKLINQPDTEVSRIEEMLENHPKYFKDILKLVECEVFGSHKGLTSYKEVMDAIGFERVRELITIICARELMDVSLPGYGIVQDELFKHSIAVSIAAEKLVDELNLTEIKNVLSASLFHDIGMLSLNKYVEEHLTTIETFTMQGLPFVEAESIVIGMDHAQLGAQILKTWSFPTMVVKAVRYHHDPESCEPLSPLTDIIHIANILCLTTGIGIGREDQQDELSALAAKRLGIKTTLLELVASYTLLSVNEVSECIMYE